MKRFLTCLAVVSVIGLGPLTSACTKTPADRDYEARVKDSLKTAKLDDVKADWKDDEKALHLSGKVEAAADKARAEELAQQVVGTSGRIVNEVEVKGIDYAAVDKQIEDRLNKMFEDRTEWDFDGRGVTFKSNQGVVSITGTVESDAVKTKIGERARATEGVKDVVNDLEVKPVKNTANPKKK